jgi:2-polyprenyl-3-methyl-5-hydroxy-6-metoxy-1,4-benzoquinol methylase
MCLLCGSQQNKVFAEVESFGFPLVYYQCENCGLIYQSPQSSQAADPDFYAETYRKIYQSTDEPTSKDLWVQEQRALALVKILQTALDNPPQRALDIGASTGILLESIRNAFGSDVVGVEPGDAYRRHAQTRGIEMYATLDEILENNLPQFDLISMIHVLEHLPDPISTLSTIRKNLLKESGVLLLEVPNFYAHDSYELAHLVCYTPHSLQTVLRQAGYHVFFFLRHGFPRSSFLNLYLTLLAQPLPDEARQPAISPDRLVGLKREAGMLYRRLIQKLFPHKAWLSLPNERTD